MTVAAATIISVTKATCGNRPIHMSSARPVAFTWSRYTANSPEMIATRARRITIIASVTMKDGMRKKLKSAPLNNPIATPTGIPNKTPGNPSHCAPSAPIKQAIPNAEPTDRSMNPAVITKVMPRARIARTGTCSSMRDQFRTVRNLSPAVSEKKMTRSRNAT